MIRRALWLMLALAVAGLTLPQLASAHATLEGSVPGRGAELQRAPDRIVLRFDEPVEAAFGAVRVFDQAGKRVDRGGAEHPDGRSNAVAIGLSSGLDQGTYTVTFRVVSADSHPVSGGYVFTVGHGGAPAESLDQLIDAGGAGRATEIGFGIVRGLSYLAIALAIGGAAFLLAAWRPALGAVSLRPAAGGSPDAPAPPAAGGSPEATHSVTPARPAATVAPVTAFETAAGRFGRRARTIALVAVVLGIVATALGIVFQGAVASGGSFWSALETTVVSDVLHTRFGTVWGLRLLAWIALYATIAAYPRAQSLAVGPGGILLGFIAVTPALAGHASTVGPSWLLVPANVIHVVAMSVWVGGVAMLLFAVPAATRTLDRAADRTRLLAAVVTRFSTVALLAVAALVAGGTVQAIAELDSFGDLLQTPFGRAILIKIGIVVVLIALGAWNRQRVRPRLAALAAGGEGPGATGVELRRSLRAEIALMVAAIGVTAALVSYAPATAAQSGPFSADATLGSARLELTVDPARAGRNEVHLYLFDRRSGRQYDRTKELTVSARLPDRGIGPLPLDPAKAGPGHYVIRGATLAPAGDWTLSIAARVSEFDEYTTRMEVPIR